MPSFANRISCSLCPSKSRIRHSQIHPNTTLQGRVKVVDNTAVKPNGERKKKRKEENDGEEKKKKKKKKKKADNASALPTRSAPARPAPPPPRPSAAAPTTAVLVSSTASPVSSTATAAAPPVSAPVATAPDGLRLKRSQTFSSGGVDASSKVHADSEWSLGEIERNCVE